MDIIKTDTVENVENSTVRKFKDEPLSDEQYIPSTSGSGMKIITHIPRYVLPAHPGLCMMAMKFQTVTVARL